MPISATNRTLLESHPHTAKFYLVVHQPRTALACRVNGAPTGDPIISITFDTVTDGAFGNVEGGQTLLVGSAAGLHDRGIVRVKSATSTVLSIAESSDLDTVVDNDFLTVLYEHRFWVKLPRIVSLSEIYEDYDVVYTNENTAFGPIAMLGPSAFYFLDSAPVQIPYDFSDSYPIAGATISSYATVYQEGDGGSSATATHTEDYTNATGMAGSETKLTVTDDNAIPANGWRYDFVLDRSGSDAPIIDFFIDSPITGSWAGIEELSFTLYGSAAQTVLRDGAHVWVIYESWYDGTSKEISTEYPNRANILFEGWVVKDSVVRAADHSTTKFVAEPTREMMKHGRAFPATLELSASPSSWIQVSTCTQVKAALYLAKWRSTLSEIVDIHIPSTATATAGHDWGSGNFLSQMEDCLKDALLSLVQHKSGQLWIEKDARLMSSTERTSLELNMIIESQHWVPPINVPVEPLAQINYVFTEGVAADGDTGFPYFSEAPGLAPKYRGDQGGKYDNLAIATQEEINQLSGDILASKNAQFPEVPVKLTGFWPVFDVVPQMRVRLGLSASNNNRGIDISGYNMLVRGYKIVPDFQLGTATTELTLVEETDGEDGESVTYTISPPSPVNPVPYPGPYIPPYTPPTRVPNDTGRRMLATDVGCIIIDDIGNSNSRWYLVNNGLSTVNDKYMWAMKRDPFHWWTSGGSERILWAVTKTGVWKHEDFPHGTWSQQVSFTDFDNAGWRTGMGTLWYARMGMSIEVEGRYAVNAWNTSGGGGSYEYVSVLNGSVIANVHEHYATNDGNGYGDVKFAPHGGGLVLYSVGNRAPGSGGSSEATLNKSTDGGASWAAAPWWGIDTINVNFKGTWASISIPYIDAASTDQFILWGRGGVGVGMAGKYRISTDGGTTFSDIPGANTNQSKLGTGGDADHIFLLGADTDDNPSKYSADRGVSYTSLPVLPINEVAMAAYVKWEGGVITSALVGTENAAPARVYSWSAGAAAWTDETRNLADFGVAHIYDIDRDSMGEA